MTRTSEFKEKGYILVSGLLSAEQVLEMIQNLDRLCESQCGGGGWTVPDGVSQTSCFWPLIFNENLLAAVRALLGENIRFVQHNDLHVDFSSYNWHRDSVSRKLGEGPDWDETEPYAIVRIGFYLQPRGTSSFRLGLLPGTHRTPAPSQARERRRLERVTGSVNLVRRIISQQNPSPRGAEWLSPADGDAVIFDPRVIHTGSRAEGRKYSIFLAYGVPNQHYFNHSVYYRFLRPELGYQAMSEELIQQLKARGLYQEVNQTNRVISGATIPGFLQTFIARRIRHRASAKTA